MSKIKFYIGIIIILVFELPVLPLLSCANNSSNSNSSGSKTPANTINSSVESVESTEETTEEITETTEPEETDTSPKYPQYVLPESPLLDPEGYQGTAWVVIGKDGYLYENGYINEYLGTAPKYVNVTDDELISRAETLKYIQDALAQKGIAFCVAISPSKAGNLPQFIPDFYKTDHITPEGYIRPYIRFKKFLEDKGVYFVDSETVYKSVGLTNTFPKTGIHWNKLASYETTCAVIAEYERQTGIEVRHIASDGIIYKPNPPPFVGNEQDIFGVVYSGKRQEMKTAIIDDKYYWHEMFIDDKSKPKIGHMIIQGGSFTGDFGYYFGDLKIAESVTSYYYNNSGKVNIKWENEINKTKFVLLEVNEQFVYNMGGNAPQWAENDVNILPLGKNIVDSLYDYLAANPD